VLEKLTSGMLENLLAKNNPNTVYHITTRGNHRNDIFRKEEDYNYYLRCIGDALDFYKNKYTVICYCLMTNHTYLQIQTTDLPIGNFIKRISSLYSEYFNDKYGYVGHLYQGRYGSEMIKTDVYYLEVNRCIHLNSVKARMHKLPEEYQWSSYGMYIGLTEEKMIKIENILAYFQEEDKRKSYRKYVESGMPEEDGNPDEKTMK